MSKRKAAGAQTFGGPVDPSTMGPAFDPGTGVQPAPPVEAAPEGAAPEAAAPQQGTLTMYDEKGTAVPVDPASAADLYKSRQLGFADGQKINLRDKGGRIYEANPDQAIQALSSGFGVASDAEVEAAKERKEYNTLGKTAKAFGAGAARGLTFGLSDAAMAGIGGKETREELSKLKEHHPIASTVGEVTGALAPVIASGGLGAAAEGAEGANALAHGAEALGAAGEAAHAAQGAGLASKTLGTIGILPRAVAGLGSAVERGVGHVVGDGATGLLGKVAQRALPLAAQGAVEGSLYGAGGEISEAALGDHELTAEKLIAGMKHGALLGGAGGAILGAGEIVGRAAVEKGMQLGGEQGLTSWLEDFANQRTLKAAGAGKQDISRLGKTAESQAGRVKEIGETIRNYKFEDGEKLFHPTSSTTDLLEGTTKALDEQTAKLDRTRQQISKLIEDQPHLAPDTGKILNRVDSEILAPLKESLIGDPGKVAKVERALAPLRERMTPPGLADDHPLANVWKEAQNGNEQAAKMLEIAKTKDPGLAKLIEPTPPSIDELISARKHLDDIIYPKSTGKGIPPLPPEHQAQLIQVRRIMEDGIQEASERAAKEAGKPELFSDLVDAKRTIHNLIPAKEMAEKSVASFGNRWVSPSDYMAGGSVTAGMLAGAHGGPMTALAGGAAALGNKLLRERGSSVAAALADKLSQLSRIRAVTMEVDGKIASGVRSALGVEEAHQAGEIIEKARDTVSHAGRAAYERHEEKMREIAQPAEHMERLASMVAPIAMHAPQTAAAVTQKAQQAVANLNAQAPKSEAHASNLQPQLVKPRVSASAKASAMRYAKATHDPLSIIDDIKHNRLSSEAVKAVSDNSPKLLQQIQTETLKAIAEKKTALPYEKRIQLGILLGKPTDPTLEPAFVNSIRQVYGPQPVTPKEPSTMAPKGARRPMKTTASQQFTPSQSLAQDAGG